MIIIDNSFNVVSSEASSRGNQTKFYRNGIWVKLDNQFCHEGLAESFVSAFEDTILDFPHVRYASDIIRYNDDDYAGCYCANMYGACVQFVSLRYLFRSNRIPLNIVIKDEDITKNIKNVINAVRSICHVDISQYLFRLLLLDALILNEDRHIMNLGVCYDGQRFFEAQCFDNGSSLFCVNWTYRKSKSFDENISSVRSVARPFSKFYDKQVDACMRLGAKPLVINKSALYALLSGYNNELYSRELNDRVKNVLVNRLEYYSGGGIYGFI